MLNKATATRRRRSGLEATVIIVVVVASVTALALLGLRVLIDSVEIVPAAQVAAAASSRATPQSWAVVNGWEGTGTKQTEAFTVGPDWRIDWINATDSQLTILIFDTARTSHVAVDFAMATKAGSDTTFEHRAGTYYLQIIGSSWKVGVQDGRP